MLIGFISSGILFGISIAFSNTKAKILGSFIMPIISIVPAIILLIITRINIFKFNNFFNATSWIILIITDTIVILLIILNGSKVYLSRKEIFINASEGAMMEIPQRMFMQILIFALLRYWDINNFTIWCVIVNAIVWCLGIIVQAIIMKQKFNKFLFIEILSSFIFSLGIGLVFIKTELILLPMLAHFIERIITRSILSTN